MMLAADMDGDGPCLPSAGTPLLLTLVVTASIPSLLTLDVTASTPSLLTLVVAASTPSLLTLITTNTFSLTCLVQS